MKDIQEALYRQLAKDMACSFAAVKEKDNVFTAARWSEGMRRSDVLRRAALHVICLNGKILARGEDQELVKWLKLEYENHSGAWFSEYSSLKRLDEGLDRFGLAIDDFRLLFVPGEKGLQLKARKRLEDCALSWHEGEDILQFKDDPRFTEAVVFEKLAPDMIALTASRHGKILAMAAANADADKMWQMGVNVMDGNEGTGLGTAVVTLLKEEILSRGVLPYYGTAMSHIVSQRIAVRAGFVPGFAELTAERKGDPE